MKTGPGRNRKSLIRSSKIGEPVTSEGIRSGVNWMRLKEQPKTRPEHAHQERLAQPRHTFNQDMALGQERRQNPAHQRLLTDEHLVDFA